MLYRKHFFPFFLLANFALSLLLSTPVKASTPFHLSLEELMDIEVYSAAKKPQEKSDIAAAVFVIDKEDIQRSGATNIPEVLRMAPGLQVLRISNNRWAISIRGAVREYSNKLLVMIDGRSVYSPTFSGVFWEALDLPVETIERVEVIRGPGSSIWGANAVNGVINIITQSAQQMQGANHFFSFGDTLRASSLLSYGWQKGENSYIRAYFKAMNSDQSKVPGPQRGEDALKNFSAGFRLDQEKPEQNFSLIGNLFSSSADDHATMFNEPPSAVPTLYTQKISGFNLSANWQIAHNSGDKTFIQASFERSILKHILLDEKRSTFDFDYNRRRRKKRGHEIIYGFSGRLSQDNISSSKYMWVDEASRLTRQYRAFLTDEITLEPERWLLTLSSMLEHNQYTGFEFQPSLRLLFKPDESNRLWMALSRSVRSPSRLERGAGYYELAAPQEIPAYTIKTDLRDLGSEKVDALEIGWRRNINKNFSFDITAFYNKYRDLAGSFAQNTSVLPPGYLLISAGIDNLVKAEIRGAELSFDWVANNKLKVFATYSYINIDTEKPTQVFLADVNKNFAEHSASLRTMYNLSHNLQWDNFAYYRSHIDFGNFKGYYSLDSRISWKVKPGLNLSLVGQNLFDINHQDFVPEVIQSLRRPDGRRTYLKLEWSY